MSLVPTPVESALGTGLPSHGSTDVTSEPSVVHLAIHLRTLLSAIHKHVSDHSHLMGVLDNTFVSATIPQGSINITGGTNNSNLLSVCW